MVRGPTLYSLRRDSILSDELTLLNLNVQMSHFQCTCNNALHRIWDIDNCVNQQLGVSSRPVG